MPMMRAPGVGALAIQRGWWTWSECHSPVSCTASTSRQWGAVILTAVRRAAVRFTAPSQVHSVHYTSEGHECNAPVNVFRQLHRSPPHRPTR